MIFLYSLFVLVLGVAGFLARRRASMLESKYTRIARQADQLLRQSGTKEGNSNRNDPYLTAKRQYVLGQVAQKRDRVEARYAYWQQISEKLNRYAGRVRTWKGLKLPYSFGVIDVASVLWLIDRIGFGDYVSAGRLFELVRTYLGR
jgi:hypothetical protein